MSLKKYWEKRKFDKTPEPKGKVLRTSENRFVVQEHFAEKAGHHFDFRLEMPARNASHSDAGGPARNASHSDAGGDGVLKSWAVPKGVPGKKGVKHLAIQTEDHPIGYINFEGKIPKGNYGAGIVKIYDKGKYELVEKTKDKIIFGLKGKKLKGNYCLVKMPARNATQSVAGGPARNATQSVAGGKGRGKQWLLFKIK